jgi:TetR/AcrR family transcriptional regulator
MQTKGAAGAEPTRGQRRKARTVQAILEAAERQFLERGYAPTTLEAIADEADVAVGSIYFHFAGKDDLFLAVVERAIEQLTAYEDAALIPELPPREQLMALGDGYLRFALKHPRAFHLLAFPHGEIQAKEGAAGERQARIDARADFLITRLTGIVQRVIDSGARHAIDAERAARFMWGAWNGVILLHLFPVRLRLGDAEIVAVIAEGRRILNAGFDALLGLPGDQLNEASG